ncbi:MAG: hypothetical protein WC947_05540 [Elusimicrobiota bacterium]
MKIIIILSVLLFLSQGCTKNIVNTNEHNYSTKPDEYNNMYGEWKLSRIEEFGGHLVTDEKVSLLLSNPIIIKKDYFSFMGEELNHPIYQYHKIEFEEGVVPEKTSAFYGYKMERKYVDEFRVLKNEKFVDAFEIISNDEILCLFDGRFLIFKKN